MNGSIWLVPNSKTAISFRKPWKHFRYFANIITAPKMDRSHNQETHFGLVQSTGIRYLKVSEFITTSRGRRQTWSLTYILVTIASFKWILSNSIDSPVTCHQQMCFSKCVTNIILTKCCLFQSSWIWDIIQITLWLERMGVYLRITYINIVWRIRSPLIFMLFCKIFSPIIDGSG